MKLAMYVRGGRAPEPGVVRDDGSILPVGVLLGAGAPRTVSRLLAAWDGVRDRLGEGLAAVDADPECAVAGRLVPAAEATLREPLGERGLIVCTGANFRSHLEEMGEPAPKKVAWSVKSPNAVIGTGAPIVLPAHAPADRIDYEGELAVVFGCDTHAVTADEARSHIAGYTILNDVSDRSTLPGIAAARTASDGRWAWTDMLLGKQYPSFAPLGPVVLTADDVPDPGALRLRTTLNDVLMQDAFVSELAVDIPHLVEQLSQHFSFRAGDVITTGTPAGVGVAQKPAVFLRPGDSVTVEVIGIGALTNGVVAGRRAGT